MRSIQIRRHAITKHGPARGHGSHLSAAGVRLARTVGETTGPFDLVLTSTVPRTLETAIALGFAVDEQLAVLGDLPADVLAEIGHSARWTWSAPFARFAAIVGSGGATARLGRQQQACWRHALEAVPAHGQVLVISHGRIIEVGLVTCFPDRDFARWGTPFHHLEGVELQYTGSTFTQLRFLRVDQPAG
jgi:broad specificity phosphatase PhoE